MDFTLKNECLEVGFALHGGEMKSLKSVKTGLEYMWEGDPAYWGRTAPVLFPFVGGVFEKQYRTKGQTYPMGQHGFARDMDFVVESQTNDSIRFALSSSDATRARYPYDFVLKLGYELQKNQVRVLWRVENPMEETLPFSIGGHPAFRCPIDPETEQTDYLLKIEGPDSVVSTRLSENGLATEARDEYLLQKGYLPIREDLFDKDALVIEHDQAHSVSLCRTGGKPYLTVDFTAPLFGIWSPPKKHAPFVCIEPWYGRCDPEGYRGLLQERAWGQSLLPKENWEASYTITILE